MHTKVLSDYSKGGKSSENQDKDVGQYEIYLKLITSIDFEW
jgi:hypothetical protein